MKTPAKTVSLALGAVVVLGLTSVFWPVATTRAQSSGGSAEFVTIHWAGKDNTHLIRPGGKVEFIGGELRKLQRPDRCDERAFYLNAAMNGLARDGFEVVTVFNDDVVMKRLAHP